jgi:hypothetical protein
MCFFYIVCTKPRDIGWREVDMCCVEDDMGRQPVIYGGLTVWGWFYVPAHDGDMLRVEIMPLPQQRYVDRSERNKLKVFKCSRNMI